MAEWWNKGTPIPFNDDNFQKIIDFYVFNCPCETEKGTVKKGTKTYTKVSKRAVTLRAKGWTRGFLNTLFTAMKKTVSGHLEYHTFSEGTDVEIEANKIEMNTSLSDSHFEMLVMADRSDMNKTSAVFYYIRNAFAHGSFSVVFNNNNKVYYLESSKNGVVKARIRLNEKTLLKWIKDFSLSPNALRNVLVQDAKKKRKKKKKVA